MTGVRRISLGSIGRRLNLEPVEKSQESRRDARGIGS
jgi:hypothetical protein